MTGNAFMAAVSSRQIMAKTYERITEELAAWIGRQRMFFVATSPLVRDGHVNCSPKGGDAFRLLDPLTVAYLDLTGSGAETIAHLRENGRIVVMFCAFDGPPRIVALGFQLADGKLIGPRDMFDDPGYDRVRDEANMIADHLRKHGPFEPHRLPLEEMEYTTMPAVAAKLTDRWGPIQDAAEKQKIGAAKSEVE